MKVVKCSIETTYGNPFVLLLKLRGRVVPLFYTVCAAVIPMTACNHFTVMPTSDAISITPAQDTAWLTGPNKASFEIPIVVRNAAPDAVYTYWCGIQAERLIDGTWQKAFTENCLAIDDRVPVPPGRSVVLTFLASAALNAITPSSKVGLRLAPGVYRAILPLWREDRGGNKGGLPEDKRRSATFIVAARQSP